MPLGDVYLKPINKGKVPPFPFFIECRNREKWELASVFVKEHKEIRAWWGETFAKAIEVDKCPLLVFTRNFFPVYVAFDTQLLVPVIKQFVNIMQPMVVFQMEFLLDDGGVHNRWVNITLLEDFFRMFPVQGGDNGTREV